jgi:hypothetical protein
MFIGTKKLGQWSKRYYAVFVDWQKKPWRFPLGDNLKIARDRMGELRNLNGRRYDFDQEKLQRKKEAEDKANAERKRITFTGWAERYFEMMINPAKSKRSVEREKVSLKHLKIFFGSIPLSEIKKGTVQNIG